MAIKITEDCINCGACEPECPNTAIYEAAYDWKYSDGTSLIGDVILPDGKNVNADTEQEPVSDEFYFIVTDKCTECKGFHDEPQCAAVCPVDCCVPDEDNVESEEERSSKHSIDQRVCLTVRSKVFIFFINQELSNHGLSFVVKFILNS